ncbi:MAG: hypothetical protein ACKOC5_12170 [Chloroflexota bacterium]
MAKTVMAVHDGLAPALGSVQALLEQGYPAGEISLACRLAGSEKRAVRKTGKAGQSLLLYQQHHPDAGAVQRALGLQAVKAAGMGVVLVSGRLGEALRSGFAGGAGLMNALLHLGVPEERAHYYAEAVRQGGALLMLRTPDYRTGEAVTIIRRHQPLDLPRLAAQWRRAGWNGFGAP